MCIESEGAAAVMFWLPGDSKLSLAEAHPKAASRWFLKLGSVIAANLRHTGPKPGAHRLLDEMAVVIYQKR